MDFTPLLLDWYTVNRRDLPWRRTTDPYRIWLSEIILQQTRIDQGLPYYERFVRAYPTVHHLAAAGEEEILKSWQGLGYYSRARNLHAAAGQIIAIHGGVFPPDYRSILDLKGVGGYTAAAIASIAFGEAVPVVDGNVIRFLARLFGITDPAGQAATLKRIEGIAREAIDPARPGDFNQAMMEFGALVCTPLNPGCAGCIFSDRCEAFKKGLTGSIPAFVPKKPVKEVWLHYLVITEGHNGEDRIYLNRRTTGGIWKNLYDFPAMEPGPGTTGHKAIPLKRIRTDHGLEDAVFLGVHGPVVHLLSHRRLHIRFYRFHAAKMTEARGVRVDLARLDQYPVPRVIERYITSILFR